MKDTFWCKGYKGHFIHGHYDRDLNKEVIRIQVMKPDGGFTMYDAKSFHSAKYKITRFMKAAA
jgi:hypothetical protein